MAHDFYGRAVFSTNSSLQTLSLTSVLQITYINNQMHEDVAQSVKLLLLNKLE